MKDYQHILVCTDFSDASMAAARRGADLVQRYGAKLSLLHVIEHFPVDIPNEPVIPEALDPAPFYREQASQKLKELADKLGHANAVQEVIISTSSARYEIRHLTEKEQVDLIILGSHGGGLLHTLGSTSMGVTYDIPCDVLVVRGTE